ncbi:MAG: hypothetical protein QW599_05660 [Nitrososphaerota archaeon]
MKKGETRGRVVNTPYGTRVYWKPTLRKIIFRKPGVNRKSDKVIERNKLVAEVKPSKKCKGLPWEKFIVCLRENMPKSPK